MNGSSGEVRDIRDAMFDGFMAEKFQDYDPQLATAHDNSRFNQPVEAVTGMDLGGQYQKGSEGMKQLVNDEQSGKLTGMRDNYLDESAKLYDGLALSEQRANSDNHREELGDKVVNSIPPKPETTLTSTPLSPPKTEKRETQETDNRKPPYTMNDA